MTVFAGIGFKRVNLLQVVGIRDQAHGAQTSRLCRYGRGGGGSPNPVNSRFRLPAETIAEHVRVFQDPVNGRVHSEVSTRFLRLDPFVTLYFAPLNFQIFLQVHFNTGASPL